MMENIDDMIHQKEKELEALKAKKLLEVSEDERDKMLTATLQALLAVEELRRIGGYQAARIQTAQWYSGKNFNALGTYRAQRQEIYDILVLRDLIDPKTDKFRFGPGRIC